MPGYFSQHTSEAATSEIIGKNLNGMGTRESPSYSFSWPILNILTHTQRDWVDPILKTLQSSFYHIYMASFNSYFKKPEIITDDLQITALGV